MGEIEKMMANVTLLGNDMLVAQARAALEYDGFFVTPDTCKAAFIACSHMIELAQKSCDAGSLTIRETTACQAVASLAMQIWATLSDMLINK